MHLSKKWLHYGYISFAVVREAPFLWAFLREEMLFESPSRYCKNLENITFSRFFMFITLSYHSLINRGSLEVLGATVNRDL